MTTIKNESTQPVLTLRLGGQLFALPIESVEEVLPALSIESVPECPPFVRGVVFVRGHVIPVISAAERLGIENYQRPAEPNIVCLKVEQRLIGVEFDEALDLININDDESLAANEIGANPGLFTGVIDHDGQIIRLLDPQRFISETESSLLNKVPLTA